MARKYRALDVSAAKPRYILPRLGAQSASNRRHNKGPVTRRGLSLPDLHKFSFPSRIFPAVICFVSDRWNCRSPAAYRLLPSRLYRGSDFRLSSGLPGRNAFICCGMFSSALLLNRSSCFADVCVLRSYGFCPSYVHGSHPAAVRLVMNLWFVTCLPTFGNSISISAMRHFSAGGSFRFCPASPGPLSASFDIISSLCSDPLLRHHTHQYAHRPLGAYYFWLSGRYRSDTVFIRRRIVSGFFHVSNLTFLLPRSAFIVSNVFTERISRG